ncbi:sensor histidine kinase [Rickettsia montanensis]|uniref:sensor histidine kinase n=1 Tax=Rickettsia montanensis TaxID=33991 RepID=UPI00059D82CD|nr:ATP-binding protein [Rickettsia montanensis]
MQENHILFSIKDNGIGALKEELQSIFGVFVVSSKTRTPAGCGGVGLALCKKVIELHAGKIWAENDKQGKTTFIFTMPL